MLLDSLVAGLADKVQPKNANNIVETMRLMFREAARCGELSADPATGLGGFANPQRPRVLFTDAKVVALLDHDAIGTI